MKQRDKMRELFGRFNKAKDLVVVAYVEAEVAGDVKRKKNVRGISRRDYAERLFADGVRKKWIFER